MHQDAIDLHADAGPRHAQVTAFLSRPSLVKPVRELPTPRSQLDFFAGTCKVYVGNDWVKDVHVAWKGESLHMVHPREANGYVPRYADSVCHEGPF